MEVPQTFYELVENTCRDLYIQSLKEIPPDVVAAIKRAAESATKEVERRIFSHYLKSIALGQEHDVPVTDEQGRLAGVVSCRTILKQVMERRAA